MRRRRVWRSAVVQSECPACEAAVSRPEAKPRVYRSEACANRARALPPKRRPVCDGPVTNRASTFCSQRCYGEHRYVTQTRPRIEAGGCFVNSTLKAYLVRERGACCEVCEGPAVWEGKPLSLHVDHVDGDPDHNLPENLRLLCPNGHSQMETYTARNRKNAKRNRYLRRYKSTRTQR